MRQPPGYEDKAWPNHVCLLEWSLYGLKQAPRAWFVRLQTFLVSIGFVPSKTDVSLFVYSLGAVHLYFLVYVDDILVMGSDSARVVDLVANSSCSVSVRVQALEFLVEPPGQGHGREGDRDPEPSFGLSVLEFLGGCHGLGHGRDVARDPEPSAALWLLESTPRHHGWGYGREPGRDPALSFRTSVLFVPKFGFTCKLVQNIP
ncbi:uncharacterized protein LOC116005797 [Ipomoea triloba]|uniref:uncharacterized protein LOC116005797 n=1 Tax=Ipomoea triloba TaxID=35885 RepID=UPI00125E01D7|nr:uncharacterized protein LOC116005797 [Ipomoea triloba]